MVNVSWHPSRARCAVSVGRRIFLVDGVTGATLSCVRLPIAHVALAHRPRARRRARGAPPRRQPPRRGPRRLPPVPPTPPRPHRQRQEARPRAPRPTRPSRLQRRPVAPWVVFALPGDATLRAASLRGPAAGLDALSGAGSSSDHASLTSGSAGSSFGGETRDASAAARSSSAASTAASIARRVGLVSGSRGRKDPLCFAYAANTKNPSRASPDTPPNPSLSRRTSTAGFEPTTSRRKPPSPSSIEPRGCRRRVPRGCRRARRCWTATTGAWWWWGTSRDDYARGEPTRSSAAPTRRSEASPRSAADRTAPAPAADRTIAPRTLTASRAWSARGRRWRARTARPCSPSRRFPGARASRRSWANDDADAAAAGETRAARPRRFASPRRAGSRARTEATAWKTIRRGRRIGRGGSRRYPRRRTARTSRRTPPNPEPPPSRGRRRGRRAASNGHGTCLVASVRVAVASVTVFLASASGGSSPGRRLCELTCPDHVPTASVAAPTPPPRPRHAWFLGGDALWRVDLADGPSCADASSSRRRRPPHSSRRPARRAPTVRGVDATRRLPRRETGERRGDDANANARTRTRPGGSRSW